MTNFHPLQKALFEEAMKDWEEEFDWREVQYEGKNYAPVNSVKNFIKEQIYKAYNAGDVNGFQDGHKEGFTNGLKTAESAVKLGKKL